MSTDKELYKLELLSLVSRVSQELFNHTKLQDKNLAEFVISVCPFQLIINHADLQLHEQSKTLAVFETKLNEIGADFPQSFVKNLDRLIVTMHPKYKRKAAKLKAAKAKANGTDDKAVNSMDTDIKSRKFPGLAMPDSEWRPLDAYLDGRTDKEPEVEKLPESISMDNTMAELAAVASRRNRPAAEDYIDGEPSNKRMRNSGGHERDNGYGSRNGQQGREQDGGYGSRLGGSARGRPGYDAIDEKPTLYKIYPGNVTNVRDFGAFVQLEGIRGRVEGESTLPILLMSRSHPRIESYWITCQLGHRGHQEE
jgi:ATP-dependent RNA helicase DHX8/PRP22